MLTSRGMVIVTTLALALALGGGTLVWELPSLVPLRVGVLVGLPYHSVLAKALEDCEKCPGVQVVDFGGHQDTDMLETIWVEVSRGDHTVRFAEIEGGGLVESRLIKIQAIDNRRFWSRSPDGEIDAWVSAAMFGLDDLESVLDTLYELKVLAIENSGAEFPARISGFWIMCD